MSIGTRPLGSTGLAITEVGFGAWAIGGGEWTYGWGSQDDASSIRALLHAAELGVNWIDTAPVYGYGRSEEVVGRALRQMPPGDRPLIFSKCGMLWDEADRFRDPLRTLEPASIRRECEDSLRRLGLDTIDLWQFHWPDLTGVPVEDSWAEAVRLRDEGKVRHIGVCNFDVALLERCEPIAHVETVQSPFSMIRRETGGELRQWSLGHGSGLLCYSPMQSGVLTGGFTRERAAALPRDDHRAANPEYHEPQLARNLEYVERIRPIAERLNISVGALAIAWVLQWPGISAAIVGARSPEQIDGWVGAPDVRLSAQDLEDITRAIERTGVGAGPIDVLATVG
jgi:Predicted oxidoreductases (related to aryl-alcohol dehydrogenases)